MPYKISKSAIKDIAEAIPDAVVIENTDKIEVVLPEETHSNTVFSVATINDEENLDEQKKNKRQQLLAEIREVQSLKQNLNQRVLSSIVNNAVRSIYA